MPFDNRKLISESKWTRVYQLGDENKYLHESKFLFDDLDISLSAIKNDWATFPLEEKVEFARAFSSKRDLTEQDEAILNFLMEDGPAEVWMAIATRLPSHRDCDRVKKFLFDRIATGGKSYANYFQAIELIHATEAVAILKNRYDEYRSMISDGLPDIDAIGVWTDYLSCCKTLLNLTHDRAFLDVLRMGPTNAPPMLRAYAGHLLREVEKASGGVPSGEMH